MKKFVYLILGCIIIFCGVLQSAVLYIDAHSLRDVSKWDGAAGFMRTLAELPKIMRNALLEDQRFLVSAQPVEHENSLAGKSREAIVIPRYDPAKGEAVIDLFDVNKNKVIYTWNPDLDYVASTLKSEDKWRFLSRDGGDAQALIFHPVLHPDGSVVFHINGGPLIKVDRCSEIEWVNSSHIYHHSIEYIENAGYWVPYYNFPVTDLNGVIKSDKLPVDGGYHQDGISFVGSSGETLFAKKLSRIFANNEMLTLFPSMSHFDDPFHINDIQPTLADGSYWKAGDVFLSLRSKSMIVLYRPSEDKIVWWQAGPWKQQHDVDTYQSDRVSIFDNNVATPHLVRSGPSNPISEIKILDMKSKIIKTVLSDSLTAERFFSGTQGQHKLMLDDNGEVQGLWLVQSDKARILKFTKDGKKVFQWDNQSDGRVYKIGWVRFLDTLENHNFLTGDSTCG